MPGREELGHNINMNKLEESTGLHMPMAEQGWCEWRKIRQEEKVGATLWRLEDRAKPSEDLALCKRKHWCFCVVLVCFCCCCCWLLIYFYSFHRELTAFQRWYLGVLDYNGNEKRAIKNEQLLSKANSGKLHLINRTRAISYIVLMDKMGLYVFTMTKQNENLSAPAFP